MKLISAGGLEPGIEEPRNEFNSAEDIALLGQCPSLPGRVELSHSCTTAAVPSCREGLCFRKSIVFHEYAR